jgi:nucleotide-binding universal stress UspA family protein
MKILLATDGSKYAMEAAKKSCEILSITNNSQLRIVSVADVSQPLKTEPFGVSSDYYLNLSNQLKETARTVVEEAKKLVQETAGTDVEIETSVLTGTPKVEIVEDAESWGADLIVIGSHGYGFFERMLIGSVSDAILHHAPCSVLIVKIEGKVEKNEE